jgi:hypothetical protein
MVSNIVIQRITITNNPLIGDFKPKKAIDHSILNASCMPNIINPFLTNWVSDPLRHTRKREIPMSTKSVIQTGPKSQLGGLNEGFFSVAYQVEICGVVKTEPMIPASWHMKMLMISRQISGR